MYWKEKMYSFLPNSISSLQAKKKIKVTKDTKKMFCNTIDDDSETN